MYTNWGCGTPHLRFLNLSVILETIRNNRQYGVTSVPLFKVTMLFQHKEQGWSENWWVNGPDFNTVHPYIFGDGNNPGMVDLRNKFLPQDSSIKWVRVSTSPGTHVVDVYPYYSVKGPGQFTYILATNPPTAKPSLCMLYRTTTLDGRYANHYFHGLPADQFVGDAFAPNGQYLGAIGTFQGYINSTINQVTTVERHRIEDAATGRVPIYGIFSGTGGNAFSLTTGQSVANKSYIRIRSSDLYGVNGIHRVVNVTAPVPPATNYTFYLAGHKVPDTEQPSVAYWELMVDSTSQITGGLLIRLTNHKVGRVFAQPVGRQGPYDRLAP